MNTIKIKAAALALLAGSALSSVTMAQEQNSSAGSSTQSGARILPQGSSSGEVQSGAQVESQATPEPSQDAGSTTSEDAEEPAAPSDGSAKTSGGTSEVPAEAETSTDADASNETSPDVDITVEQKTEIHNIIVEQKVEPVDIEVEVSIGTAVPKTITLHPLPPRIVEIVPAYAGYQYFILADGRIVIVKPATYEVVYILVV